MLQNMELNFSSQVENLQLQIGDLEKELGVLMEKFNADETMQESSLQDLSGLTELYNKIQTLQIEMDNVTTTTTQLMDDREERQMHINALLEQIELLKTVKADKEDLEDALAEKADHAAVNRKVSHDQFDAACNDLASGLEDALFKLNEQKKLWEEALNDVQHEIENKLDRTEISSLVDFVNSKLKNLHERLQALAAIRKDIEAAGIKRKILRDVKCISCDKDVVMKIDNEPPSSPTKGAMPPSRSVRPYLTYELDMVRKQQRRQPHICNRYCGGSHTVTTAQQRVSRVGHFLEQWGPEAIQLLEGGVKGTDGRMYKARGKVGSPLASPRMVSVTTSPMKFPEEGLQLPVGDAAAAAHASLEEIVLQAVTLEAEAVAVAGAEAKQVAAAPAQEVPEAAHEMGDDTSGTQMAQEMVHELIRGGYPSVVMEEEESAAEAAPTEESAPSEEVAPSEGEAAGTEEPEAAEEPPAGEEPPATEEESSPAEEPAPAEPEGEAAPAEES
ncbi:glutamine-rich protein 2-like [Schistocerca serialis cubense]|uniref:glutamine-rich protein 2-like n=1 Tax=Schistocerca serialis cubense TaxID=2023355 RepID=UPI00214F4A3B|nr:glutamine-rich protein 2-like [Schistocerca serialis cubense]